MFCERTFVAVGFRTENVQFHPVVAVGMPSTPPVAVPPVPTLILNVVAPLLVKMLGLVPNPLEIVGAAVPNKRRLLLTPLMIPKPLTPAI